MNIKNMNKAKILATLYNHSKPQGMGFLHPNSANEISEEEARQLLDSGQTYFDYLNGRVMKINLSGDELKTGSYNRDNGINAAEKALGNILGDKVHASASIK